MAGSGALDRDRLEKLFKELDRELRHEPARVEVYVAGGARMAFGLRIGRSTNDVDGIIRQGHGAAVKAIRNVARRHKLDDSWMNEAMTQSLPTKPDRGEETLYYGARLTIKGASTRHMLGMKIYAGRKVDIDDAEVLVRRLGLKTTREIEEIGTTLYGTRGNEALDTIRESVNKLAQRIPELTVNHSRGTNKDTPPVFPEKPPKPPGLKAKGYPEYTKGEPTWEEPHQPPGRAAGYAESLERTQERQPPTRPR